MALFADGWVVGGFWLVGWLVHLFIECVDGTITTTKNPEDFVRD